jgi:nucleolar protein 12
VPFKKPTAQPSDTDSTKNPQSKSENSKSARTHDVERTSAWRKTQEDDNAKDEKKFLTPAEKKRIAFINHEFHTSADTVNSYIVFAHPVPSSLYPKNVPPPKQIIDPYEAARLAVKMADGSMFMDRALRVDLATKEKEVRRSDGKDNVDALVNDPKLTVFVGNLDFESKEEDLRVFFEDVLKNERGAPPKNTDKLGWVRRVRIVRDKDTLLGKGFAYIQFAVCCHRSIQPFPFFSDSAYFTLVGFFMRR